MDSLFFRFTFRSQATLTIKLVANNGMMGLAPAATAVLFRIAAELASIEVVVGPGLLSTLEDHNALLLVINGIKETCTMLRSFSITMESNAWRTDAEGLVLNWAPSVVRKISIVHPGSETCTASKTIFQHHGREVERVVASIPLDRCSQNTIISLPWRFHALIVGPALDLSHRIDTRDLLDLLPHQRDLQELSLPFELMGSLRQILFHVSALPLCNVLTLTVGPSINLFSLSQAIPAFLIGMEGFHHLVKLCLPGNSLFPSVHLCLSRLKGLSQIRIITSDPFPTNLKVPKDDDFSNLRTLKITGFFPDLGRALLAFVNTNATTKLHTVKIKCPSRSTINLKAGMAETFRNLKYCCPSLQHFSIDMRVRAQDSDACAQLYWHDLKPLAGLHGIKTFVLQYPKTPPLCSRRVNRFLRAWPSAESVFFNDISLLSFQTA